VSRRAYEETKRRLIEHQQKTGRPITERQADKVIRPVIERADRERSGATKTYRDGERQ
jgi:hypothetical protein